MATYWTTPTRHRNGRRADEHRSPGRKPQEAGVEWTLLSSLRSRLVGGTGARKHPDERLGRAAGRLSLTQLLGCGVMRVARTVPGGARPLLKTVSPTPWGIAQSAVGLTASSAPPSPSSPSLSPAQPAHSPPPARQRRLLSAPFASPGVPGSDKRPGRLLPLGFHGEAFSGPCHVGHCIAPGDVHHRMAAMVPDEIPGPRVRPSRCRPRGREEPGNNNDVRERCRRIVRNFPAPSLN